MTINATIRKPIYLDYAATTPVAPEVALKMSTCLTIEGQFANPASRSHLYGWQAEELVEHARGQVAQLINSDPREIVWTSGATEANNLAIKGAAEKYRQTNATGGHIITTVIEHKAVLDPMHWLENHGFTLTYIPPNSDGVISVEQLQQAFKKDTFLVSVMQVNNELGSINNIQALTETCKNRDILFHCDAAQAAGKIAIDVKHLGVDLLSLSAHKFYGPKGIGALYVRRAPNVVIAAQIHGGGHERGMRSGTLATHQCVGMGEAAELAQKNLIQDAKRIAQLRDKLWSGICDLPHIQRNGSLSEVTAGHLNVAFSDATGNGCDGETLLLSLRELALSSGSACNSATLSPSYVLKAIGLNDAQAKASLRFSLGRYTTQVEIDLAVKHIRDVVEKLSQ